MWTQIRSNLPKRLLKHFSRQLKQTIFVVIGPLRVNIYQISTVNSEYDQEMPHNGTLQTNPRHDEEEAKNKNRNMTFRTPQKSSNQPSLPKRGDCKTGKDTELCITKQGPNTKPTQTMGATISLIIYVLKRFQIITDL